MEVELPSHPDSVARARRTLLELDGRVAPARLEDLRLLVSEVVTNAIRHGGGDEAPVRLRILEDGDHVRVEVQDPGAGFAPPDLDPDPERAGGWGLWLVEQLADRWGISNRGGTCVWFELPAR